MTWDGKKAEPAQVFAIVCEGCGKGNGTLERLAKNSPIAVHRLCRKGALRKLSERATRAYAMAQLPPGEAQNIEMLERVRAFAEAS